MAEKHVIVSSSPHIKAKDSTQRLMMDVLLALMPALICGMFYFGFRAFIITVISVAACVFFEYIWQRILKKPIMISDCSAVVTGVLLALNLPVTVPFWIPVIGALVAIIIVKQLFGGLGCNFMNPALAARAFLLASWPVLMTRFVQPFSTGIVIAPDLVSSATPLALLKDGALIGDLPKVSTMFLGNIGGCIGETSTIALILGGLYLVLRRVISLKIPVSFILTVAVLSFLFGGGQYNAMDNMLYNILGGGLFLGAIFMATDYVTSPVSQIGQIIMGIGCGVITFVIRRFGGYPEGVTYAILLMNVATPLIDKWCKPKKFGHVGKKLKKAKA